MEEKDIIMPLAVSSWDEQEREAINKVIESDNFTMGKKESKFILLPKLGFNSKYVVSTPVSRPKKFIEKNYVPIKEVHTDGFIRGLYNNISNDDLLEFSCKEHQEGNSKKIVRSFMIERE